VILRECDLGVNDQSILAAFNCSTGASFESDVQTWIRASAVHWASDVRRATFQRRSLAVVEDDLGATIGVVAWQDISRVDLDGIWLEVLAVDLDHQHGGTGSAMYDLTVAHLQAVARDGDHIAGLVHVDNHRCKRLLTSVGWTEVSVIDDHELWAGNL